ncbi:MAG: phosphatidate cytidylyltransferase [Planctomycetes bacterium]|jgi:phosphatidate cytidylyltransferase|nr:phosphatidate cytidylyltransferase [Planctomycetota bacterium]
MLKHRLLFGTLMTVFLVGILLLDGWLDGSLTASTDDDRPIRATILAVLIAVVLCLGGIEFSRLAAAKGYMVLNPVAMIGLALLATLWYWPQFVAAAPNTFLPLLLALLLAAMLLQQQIRHGVNGVLANCGVSCFLLLYLGLLGAFVLGIRVDGGPWEVLVFALVVKSSDIGAYTCGKLFGRHKLAPRVSPGKTWEGLAGAAVAAAGISIVCAGISGIMEFWIAPVFGVGMAVVGQLSDLAESMLKRDAQQKDSSNRVPGFGGILDVIDSLLFAAPWAYVFFRFVS